MSPAEGFDETARSLGRIEQQLDTIAERGQARDAQLENVVERQHKAGNAIQGISSQVTTLQKAVDSAKNDMTDVKVRLAALETPVKRALEQKQLRRKLWRSVVGTAVAISAGIWFVAQPVLKAVSEFLVNYYLSAGKHD